MHAEGCYLERRQQPSARERDERLGRFVRERLLEGWTPEQIAGWLRRGEERGRRPLSLETIYAFLHHPGQKAREALEAAAARARQTRPTAASQAAQRHRGTPLQIHDRPEAVQERKDAGH